MEQLYLNCFKLHGLIDECAWVEQAIRPCLSHSAYRTQISLIYAFQGFELIAEVHELHSLT